MNRKIFAVILSLLLAVMVPMTSLAATAVDISVMPGEMLLQQVPEDMRTPLVDLFNALSIRILSGENSGMLSVLLSGKNALDVAFRADEDGLFVQTALLGEKPLYFQKDDLADFVVNTMKQQGEALDAQAEAELRENVNAMFGGAAMTGVPAVDMTAVPAEPVDFTFDKDAAIAAVSQAYANDPAMMAYVTNILNSTVVTEGEFTAENRDTANVCMTMTMTGADMVLLLDSAAMESSLSQIAAQNNITVEEAKAEMKAEFEKMDMNATMVFYLIKEGSQFVGADLNMVIVEDKNDPEAETITMVMKLDRLTTDVVTYTFNMQGTEDDQPEVGADFVVVDDQNGTVNVDGKIYEYEEAATKDVGLLKGTFTMMNDILYGWFGIVDTDSQEGFTFVIASQPTNDGAVYTMDMYIRENAVAPVAPVASDLPFFTFKVDLSENMPEDGLAAVEAATVDGSVQLLKMSEEELQQFVTEVTGYMSSVAFSLLSLLPPSVLSLFMTMGQ